LFFQQNDPFAGKRSQLIQHLDVSHGLLPILQDMEVINTHHVEDIMVKYFTVWYCHNEARLHCL